MVSIDYLGSIGDTNVRLHELTLVKGVINNIKPLNGTFCLPFTIAVTSQLNRII